MNFSAYGEIRCTRRTCCKTLEKSWEKMGILPAEELALERALRASLMTKLKRKKRAAVARAVVSNEMEELDMKDEEEDEEEEEKNENGLKDDVDQTINLGCCAEDDNVPTSDSFKKLSSPNFSEDDSNSSNFGRTSCPRSATSTPPLSNRSSSTLHLFVSSSSSPCSSCCSPSSDCPWLPWSPRTERDSGKKKAIKWKKKGKNGTEDTGRKKKLKGVRERDDVEKKRLVSREKEGAEVRDLEKEGKETKVRKETWKTSLSEDMEAHKESFYQPQRKFASNHTPPVRYFPRRMEVKDCKQLPKTEDFITYLCLRGSGDIPKHLQKFASPWTPASKKTKARRRKKKVSKIKSSAAFKKLNYIAIPD